MTQPTPPASSAGDDAQLAALRLPDADQFYDVVMGEIEPELALAQLPLLEGRFAKDTPEEKQLRIERYQKALEQYDRRLQEYERGVQDVLRHYAKYVEDVAKEADSHSAGASFDSTPPLA